VKGLYELLVNPTTLLIEPPWPNARKGKKGRTIRVKDVRTGKGQERRKDKNKKLFLLSSPSFIFLSSPLFLFLPSSSFLIVSSRPFLFLPPPNLFFLSSHSFFSFDRLV
jgi:hypothetical protein